MNLDTIAGFATWGVYSLFDQRESYRASWWVHALCIIFPILILKFTHDIPRAVRLFVVVILSWHVVDVLTNAIDDGLKNDCENQACTFTASISSTEPTDEPEPRPSSPVKDSTMSNSSEPPTEDEKRPETSTSHLQNMDAL